MDFRALVRYKVLKMVSRESPLAPVTGQRPSRYDVRRTPFPGIDAVPPLSERLAQDRAYPVVYRDLEREVVGPTELLGGGVEMPRTGSLDWLAFSSSV